MEKTAVIQPPARSKLPSGGLIAAGIVALTAFLVYANTLGHGYVLDDRVVITQNSYVREGIGGIPDLLRHDSMRGYLHDDTRYLSGGRYRPLSLVLFAVLYEFFGLNPAIGHFITVALYAFCAALLFVVLKGLLPSPHDERWPLGPPFLAAMLFALHPVHTEVVANIKSCDEILALLWSLAAWYASVRFSAKPRAGWLAASGVFFFLALMAKESAITFAAVVPLSLFMLLRRPLSKALAAALPLVIASALFLVLRSAVVGFHPPQTHELLNDPFLAATATQKWATIARALWEYARILVFPHPLTYDYYPYHLPLVNWTDWRALAAVALYGGAAAYAIKKIRSADPVAFGTALYLCTLSIVSNVALPVGTFLAERFLFAPSAGFALVIASLSSRAARRAPARLVPLLLAAVALLYATKTVTRNAIWKSDDVLTTTDVTVSSGSASANAAAADFLLIRAQKTADPAGRQLLIDTAFHYLHRAIRIHPAYERALAMLGENYAGLKNNIDSSLYFYRRLYTLNPAWPNVAYNLGTLRLQHKIAELDSAIFFLTRAVEMFPAYAGAWKNLGAGYFYKKEYSRAGECFLKAHALDPNDRETLANAMTSYIAAGDSAVVRRLSGK